MTDQTKFRLSEIAKTENSFNQEINQRKSCSKKLSKHITAFDHIDKVLIVLGETSDGVSSIIFTSTVGVQVGIASTSFTFFYNSRNNQKLLSITRNTKKKHDKILMLGRSKLNSTEALVSQALIGMEISHEEFVTILGEKNKWKMKEKMKENVKNVSKKQEIK